MALAKAGEDVHLNLDLPRMLGHFQMEFTMLPQPVRDNHSPLLSTIMVASMGVSLITLLALRHLSLQLLDTNIVTLCHAC